MHTVSHFFFFYSYQNAVKVMEKLDFLTVACVPNALTLFCTIKLKPKE